MNWIDTLAPKAKNLYELMNDVRYFAKANPYQFTITSSAPFASTYQLFGSAAFRTDPNFGNQGFIKIKYAYPDYDYGSLMANLENAPVRFGKIRMESSNVLNLNSSLQVTRFDSDGTQEQDTNVFFKRLNQFSNDSVEYETEIFVDTNTLIVGNIDAMSEIRIYMYFDHYTSMKLLLNEGYLAKKTVLESPPTTPNKDSEYVPMQVDIRNEKY